MSNDMWFDHPRVIQLQERVAALDTEIAGMRQQRDSVPEGAGRNAVRDELMRLIERRDDARRELQAESATAMAAWQRRTRVVRQ
jgi:hypothetical protein